MNTDTPDKARRAVLRTRAKALAMAPEPPLPSQEGMDVVIFTIMNEHYGIEAAHVREVFPAMDVTPIPCTPRFVTGVINVRGDILAVIDLRLLFELPVNESSSPGEIIIVEVGGSVFGLLADSAIGVSFVPLADLEEPPPSLGGIREQSLRGVTPGQLIVLDIPRMLADKKLWVHEEVGL